MELDLAGAGEDGGLDVAVLLVDLAGDLVARRLAHHRDLEHPRGDLLARADGAQAREALLLEYRLYLAGRAGQQHDDELAPCPFGLEPLSGRGAVRVGESDGAGED